MISSSPAACARARTSAISSSRPVVIIVVVAIDSLRQHRNVSRQAGLRLGDRA
jgi:hypothetical protein